MLRIWSDLGMQHVTTGTSLNLKHINDALSSTILKYANMPKKAVTDTGSFFEDADQIEGFLRYYLPSWHLESESGKELIERAKYWLYGRPRFITSYVSCLIENNFRCPHQVLTNHIKAMTKFVPADAGFWESLESSIDGRSEESEDLSNVQSISVLEPFDLSRAMNFDNDLRQSVQKLVYHRLIGGRTDFESTGDGLVNIDLVERGFARYPSATQGKATFDEPLAYLATDHWITSKANNGLERYTAMCLAHVFKEFTPLSTVFDFAKIQGNRNLASKKARLVSCWINANKMFMTAPVVSPLIVNEDGGGFVDQYMSSPSKILVYTSRNPEDDINWLKFRINAPFLFPQTNFGPDLMFRLQLEGGKLLTVVLQTKYKEYASGITTPNAIQKAMNSVNPDSFYKNTKGKAYASESYDDLPKQVLDALDSLPQRHGADHVGYHSVLCGLFTCPTVAVGKSKGWQAYKEILEKIDAAKVTVNLDHEFFVVKFDFIQDFTRQMLPTRALDRLVEEVKTRWMLEAQKREEIEKRKLSEKLTGKKSWKKRSAGDEAGS
ncbi:hypothetical protein C0993_005165 [Termitomyces sp. T159_Od127]|nr:hypothetical protein C0993_005165 [Termitomyces sp. T159_Od127]